LHSRARAGHSHCSSAVVYDEGFSPFSYGYWRTRGWWWHERNWLITAPCSGSPPPVLRRPIMVHYMQRVSAAAIQVSAPLQRAVKAGFWSDHSRSRPLDRTGIRSRYLFPGGRTEFPPDPGATGIRHRGEIQATMARVFNVGQLCHKVARSPSMTCDAARQSTASSTANRFQRDGSFSFDIFEFGVPFSMTGRWMPSPSIDGVRAAWERSQQLRFFGLWEE